MKKSNLSKKILPNKLFINNKHIKHEKNIFIKYFTNNTPII